MKEFLCETQELAIGYGKTPLASGIALRAKPGQILVLVGPNGRANPPCSKHWPDSWPRWAALCCWTGRT